MNFSIKPIFDFIKSIFSGASSENTITTTSNPVTNVNVNIKEPLLQEAPKEASVKDILLTDTISLNPLSRRNIEGDWDYVCTLYGDENIFPDDPNKGNAHGGVCTIKVFKDDYVNMIIVKGNRTWNGSIKNEDVIKREKVKKERTWNSYEGVYLGKDLIEYKYTLPVERVDGVSKLHIKFDMNSNKLYLAGEFHYLVSDDLKTKRLSLRDNTEPFDIIYNEKGIERYRKIRGSIRLTNQRN